MDNWLLGYCSHCPDGLRPGRIVVLASLRKNVHGEYVVDRPASELVDDIGRTGSVFWPQNPASPHDLCGCLVRFHSTPSPEHGDPTTTKDWLRVLRGASGWEVHRIGFRIVDQGADIQWRQEPRWAKGLPEGERLFIRHRATSTIVGPWRVGRELPDVPRARELLPHPNPSKVFEYAIKTLDVDSIYDDALPVHAPRTELLLYPPDEATGQPVDLATQKQLAKWVVDRMVAAAPQAVARFDKETPGWRTKLRDEIEGYSEPERHVCRSRWERLEGALNDLVFEAESAEKLLQHPKFLARVEELVKSQVDARVSARAGEIEGEAQRKAKSTVERVEKEISDLTRQLQEAKDRRDEVSRDLQTKLDALGERERAVNELVSHLAESRERMLRDIAVYQSLLPGATPPAAVLPAEPKPTPKVSPSGPAITDAAAYIDSRLWPNLDRWHRGIPRAMSVILHAAVCGSKAVIVPTPAWARAYADSLGAQAKLTVVNVQPTWLGFDDLWRGGLGSCWERAACGTTAVELVLLRDFNRALPQCYARPLLDAIAGYADSLPEPGSGCWPANLRLMVCPSLPDESLPLTAEVVRHFAAVQRTPAAAGNDRARPATAGHVPADTWLAWCRPGQPADPDAELCKDFGPLACVAAADTATVAQVLRTFGMSEREAKRTAREIRVTEPAEYMLQSPPEAGVAR
jgi:hypothetical protein